MKYLKQEFYQILKSDEDFFDFIQMNAFDGLWFWNLEKPNDKWISPKFCNLLGYEYEQLQGNHIQKIVHHQDLEKINTIFLSYKTTDSSTIYEHCIRFIHKNGTILWIKMKALVFGSTEENNHRVVVTHTDITKEHQQEDELLRTLNRYESMLNHSSVFIVRTDLEGRYTYVNQHFCERLGLEKEKTIGQNALYAIMEQDHRKCIEAVRKCFERPNESVFVQLRKPLFDIKTEQTTSEYIYTDWEYKLIFNAEGVPQEIQCIGLEVTEKIKIQKALQEKANELEASEEELRLNLEQLEETQYEVTHTKKLLETCNEAAQIGIWELNLNNFSTTWDKITREIHEVEEDFVSDAQNGILFYKEGESRDTITRVFTKALEEGVPFDEDLKIITAKENERWVRAIGIPTFKNGKCVEMYGTFQDITEKKEAELEIEEKVNELETAQKQLTHTHKLLETSNKAAQIGTWELNLNDFTTKWNRVTKEIHEVDDNFVSTPENGILFFKEGESREIITRVFTKALEEGISYDEQIKIITAKGNEVWVRVIGIPTFENGKCVELYGTIQNINKPKEAELEIKQKVNELETTHKQLNHTQKLLDASNKTAEIGTWVLDLNTGIVTGNEITQQIHEMEEDFIVPPERGILFYKEGYSREIITRAFTRALEEGIPYDEQLKIITAKGNEIWVRTIGIPTMENGKCVEIYGTFQNINKQKQNEIILQEKLQELEVSQRQLIHTGTLLETCNASAAIGTWEYNINTRDIDWDKIVHSIYELPNGVDLDTQAKINFFKKGKSREKAVQILQEAREEGKPFDEELELINFRGVHKWVRIIGIPQMKEGRVIDLYGTFQDITPQKNAELQLKEKVEELEQSQAENQKIKNKLTLTLEKTGIGLWEINLQTNEVHWDNQIRKMLGAEDLKEGPLDRKNKFNYINEEDGKRVNKLIEDFVSNKITNYHIVYQTNPIDGEIKFHQSKAILIKNEKGIPISVLGVTQDITLQKNAELKLQDKVEELEKAQLEIQKIQSKLSMTLDKTGVGLWELNLTTGATFWDEQSYKLFQETKESFTPEKWQEKIHVQDLEHIIQNIEEVATNKTSIFDIKYRMNQKNAIHFYHAKGVLVEEDNERKIVGTVQDITKEKLAELELQQKVNELETAQQEIQNIQAKLSMTLEKTGIGFWELDLKTNKIYWDKQTKKMLGVQDNMLEKILDAEQLFQYIPTDDVQKINDLLSDFISQKIETYGIMYQTLPIKGKVHFQESKAILIKDNEGNPISVLGITQDITKQTESELQLQEKVNELEKAQHEIQKIQNKLTVTLEKTGIGLWEIDLITNQPYWSKQTRMMFGISEREEINPESTAQRIHPEDIIEVNGMIGDLITQRISQYQSIYRTVPIDGKIRYHEGKAILIKDDKGNPISVLGVTQDITQQKEHEKIIEEQNAKLAKSEQELRKGLREMYRLQKDLEYQKQQLEQIFDAVPAMIYQFKRNKDGVVSFPLVSRGSELVLGVISEEMVSDSSSDIFEAIHPDDLLGFQSSVQKSAETMQKWESELRLIKNGKEVWIHATSKPTPLDDGGILWTGIMQNIDQLKATELKIQEQNKELQAALDELRTTQSQLIHNEKMTTLGQLVASIAHEINTPLGAIRSSATSIERMLQSSLVMLSKTVTLLSDKQLDNFNLLIEKSMESNYLYSSREKRQMKYELIDSLDARKVPQSDRISDILVDIGVHQEKELYEPFIVLPNAIQILETAYQLATIARSNATVMIATEKASKIIITLKNFSRQDHTDEMRPTNINESLENTLVLYHNKLKYGIEVIREMDTLPLINAYEDELAQVWTNLLHNAIQAIATKGKIYLTTQKQDNKILVSVRDTGAGIPDEVQQKIFDAFFTTKPAGEGSGLGLNIVRKIIDKHEGKIWFETENIGKNTGTTFFVELPIK